MNINQWFKKKPQNDAIVTAHPYTWGAPTPIYKIGWTIYMKDGTSSTRVWNNVSHNELNDITSVVKDEVKQMHIALELAATEKKEFVNLSSNLLRLNDVSKIVVINTLEKDSNN